MTPRYSRGVFWILATGIPPDVVPATPAQTKNWSQLFIRHRPERLFNNCATRISLTAALNSLKDIYFLKILFYICANKYATLQVRLRRCYFFLFIQKEVI